MCRELRWQPTVHGQNALLFAILLILTTSLLRLDNKGTSEYQMTEHV
jgi:hypothetical protein